MYLYYSKLVFNITTVHNCIITIAYYAFSFLSASKYQAQDACGGLSMILSDAYANLFLNGGGPTVDDRACI